MTLSEVVLLVAFIAFTLLIIHMIRSSMGDREIGRIADGISSALRDLKRGDYEVLTKEKRWRPERTPGLQRKRILKTIDEGEWLCWNWEGQASNKRLVWNQDKSIEELKRLIQDSMARGC